MNCTVDIFGEMQVVVNDLPVDEKVNVVGMVVEEDVPLLPYIGLWKKVSTFSVR